MRVKTGREWHDRGPRRTNDNVIEVPPLEVTTSHSIDGTIIAMATPKRTALRDRPVHGMVRA